MNETQKAKQMPTIDMKETGRNVAKLRRVRGLTVRDLQKIFGFGTPQVIYKWQWGKALPTVDNLLVLASVLGVRMESILVMRGGEQGAPCCNQKERLHAG